VCASLATNIGLATSYEYNALQNAPIIHVHRTPNILVGLKLMALYKFFHIFKFRVCDPLLA
jgi:hypothetical protein